MTPYIEISHPDKNILWQHRQHEQHVRFIEMPIYSDYDHVETGMNSSL